MSRILDTEHTPQEETGKEWKAAQVGRFSFPYLSVFSIQMFLWAFQLWSTWR